MFWQQGIKPVVKQFVAPARYLSKEYVKQRYIGCKIGIGYLIHSTGYDSSSGEWGGFEGNYLENFGLEFEERHQTEGFATITYVYIDQDLPDYSSMSSHQKRLWNRDLIRADAVCHPDEQYEAMIAADDVPQVQKLVEEHIINPDNILSMCNTAIAKKGTAVTAMLLEYRHQWLGELKDPFAEFELDF